MKYDFKLNFFYSTDEMAALLGVDLNEFSENRALYMNNLAEFYEYEYEYPKGYILIHKIADYVPPDKRKEIMKEREAAIHAYILKCIKNDPYQTPWSIMRRALCDKEDISVAKFNTPPKPLYNYFEDVFFRMFDNKEIEEEDGRTFCYWDENQMRYVLAPEIEDILMKEAFTTAFRILKQDEDYKGLDEDSAIAIAQNLVVDMLPEMIYNFNKKENTDYGVVSKIKVRDPVQ